LPHPQPGLDTSISGPGVWCPYLSGREAALSCRRVVGSIPTGHPLRMYSASIDHAIID
jgi:hypothetical protein